MHIYILYMYIYIYVYIHPVPLNSNPTPLTPVPRYDIGRTRETPFDPRSKKDAYYKFDGTQEKRLGCHRPISLEVAIYIIYLFLYMYIYSDRCMYLHLIFY
jgi:hypothetical protein